MNIKSFLLILITSFILLSIANNKIENKKDNRREYVGVESKHATSITNDFYFNISTNSNEREWMLALSSQLHGVTEYSIKMGRIDILTKTDAIEVDYFHKWHESIGQALHYSIETKRRPTIALISFKTNDNVEYVKTICSNYNIRVIMLRQRL